MSGNLSQFQKFILKKIVSGVVVKDSTDLSSSDIYNFLKVKLDDDILQVIFNEGSLYGLSNDECLDQIRIADKLINANPSVSRIFSEIEMKDFRIGECLNLVYENELIGKVVVSVIADEYSHFIVTKSDIGDVKFCDTLLPINKRLNCGFPTYFNVLRGKKVVTDGDLLFSPGRLVCIERLQPGLIYEIMDTPGEFRFAPQTNNPDGSLMLAPGTDYYVSFPMAINPPAWRDDDLKKYDSQRALAKVPFIITIIGDGIAEIRANAAFRFSKIAGIRKYELNNLSMTSIITGNVRTDTYLSTRISGTLKYDPDNKIWNMTAKPSVVCRQAPKKQVIDKVASALRKKTLVDVSIDRIGLSLSSIGLSIPDKLELIEDLLGSESKALDDFRIDEIVTVGDLCELLQYSKKDKKNGN